MSTEIIAAALNGVLQDPIAARFIRAVERENVRRMLVSTQIDRVRHFEGRIRDLGLSSDEYLIVILNVDDANGGALAEVLMPGHDWSAIRASGQPFARGMAARRPLQTALSGMAAVELADVLGVAVLVMDRGIITAFKASDLVEEPAKPEP